MTPLFSILIANYNNGKYFRDCYDSIISQTYRNWEVIIVDDASTDNSIQLIADIAKLDSRFKLYCNNQNKGCGYTKRRCVELADGEICGFLDPDDALNPLALERHIDIHNGNHNLSLVSSLYEYYDEEMHRLNDRVRQRDNISSMLSVNELFFNFDGVISHFVTFLKERYNQTEGIDPYMQRAVDQDLYLKLIETGDCFLLNEYLYNYRQHKGGISTNHNTNKANYWHWVAAIAAAKRRNLNVEELFCLSFEHRDVYNAILTYYNTLRSNIIVKFMLQINSIIKKFKNENAK